MSTVIEYPDLEFSMAAYLRAGLAAWSARVDRKWPAPDATVTGYDVVVRDDGGRDQQFHADRLFAVTVLGLEGGHYETGRCAERVAALLRVAHESPAVPIVRCTSVRGPYSIDSGTHRPAFYLTADLRVVGTPTTL